MDLLKTILDLRAEKSKLEKIIAALEGLQQGSSVAQIPSLMGKRRGRKSMDGKERQQVSERMKRYWAARRKKDH